MKGRLTKRLKEKLMGDKETGALYASNCYAITGIQAKRLIRQLKVLDHGSDPFMSFGRSDFLKGIV